VSAVTNDEPTIGALRHRTARQLRESTTVAEDRLWRRLRRFPVSGTHFRRQVPIGPYVADFACMAARLVIEVDGSQHDRDDRRLRDEARTRWLEREGYRVLRFWNNDLTANMDGVLEAIYAAICGSPTAEPTALKHQRRTRVAPVGAKVTPPRRALRADPPPAGEGKQKQQP
jgi:very-short-patch-repair endonuclease